MRRSFISFIALTALATCSVVDVTAQRARSKPGSVEARFQAIEDRQEIHALLMTYGRTLDARDFGGFEQLFARDAEYGSARSPLVKGPAAIRAYLEGQLKKNAAPEPGRDFHLFYNETIEVNGDNATALSKGAFYVRGEGNKLETTAVVNYHDDLVREGGQWKFKRRILGERPATAPAQ
jgi:hypothetical protein